MRRVRVVVRGRVQGVFFRDSARRLAADAGVSGFVTNRADGALEAELEGEPEAVERLIEFFREGPPRAVVERVDVEELAPEGGSEFEVR